MKNKASSKFVSSLILSFAYKSYELQEFYSKLNVRSAYQKIFSEILEIWNSNLKMCKRAHLHSPSIHLLPYFSWFSLPAKKLSLKVHLLLTPLGSSDRSKKNFRGTFPSRNNHPLIKFFFSFASLKLLTHPFPFDKLSNKKKIFFKNLLLKTKDPDNGSEHHTRKLSTHYIRNW